MTTTPDPAEERIVARNLHLIDEVIRDARIRRVYLAEEFRSAAYWSLFRAARRIAPRGFDPDRERRYLAGAIYMEIAHVRCKFGRGGRTLVPLVVAEAAGREPLAREVAPDAMAELRETIALGPVPPPERPRLSPWRPGPRRPWRKLSPEGLARLRALIAADPARSNSAIAQDYADATGTTIHSTAVNYHRKRLGLPPSAVKGGNYLRRRPQ